VEVSVSARYLYDEREKRGGGEKRGGKKKGRLARRVLSFSRNLTDLKHLTRKKGKREEKRIVLWTSRQDTLGQSIGPL